MIPDSPNVMPAGAAAVLVAVLRQPHPTVRSVARAAHRSVSVTYKWLRWLDTQGLVAYPLGKAGALRPTVTEHPIR